MIVGLGKNKLTRYGFSAGYWRISDYSISINNQECSCVLCLYKDKAKADEDPGSFIDTYVMSTATDETKERFIRYIGSHIVRGGITEALYQMAKETEDYFKDAMVLEDAPIKQ